VCLKFRNIAVVCAGNKIGDDSMPSLGPTELIIILVIVVILFGVGRIGKIAGEMGSGIRSFREGLKGDDEEEETTETESAEEQPSKD